MYKRTNLSPAGVSTGNDAGLRRLFFAVLLAALTWVALALTAHPGAFMAGNDASRFAHIEALVDYGTSQIDQSRYHWTVDQLRINGHDYSNKPPVLSWVGAGCYQVIKWLTGWSFDKHSLILTRLLVILLVVTPTAALVGVFHWHIDEQKRGQPAARWLSVLTLACGTILTSYSTTLNNHTNAAAFLFFAFVCACRGRFGWAGLWAGITTCIDGLSGLAFIPVLLWLAHVGRGRRGFLQMLFSLAGCALLMIAANLLTVGTWLVPKLVPGAVDQAVGFGSRVGNVLLPDHWSYPIECLFGGHGFFSVSPVLLFAVSGLAVAVRRSSGDERKRLLFVALTIAVFMLGCICLVGSYGGWSYGFRYLIPVIPLLCVHLPLVLVGWRRWLFLPVLAVSILFAVLGMYNPWPPCYEQAANKDPVASLVSNPVGGNAAAWLRSHAPGSSLAAWTARRFVSPDSELQQQYFDYFERSRRIR